jgi:hypothetical protein
MCAISQNHRIIVHPDAGFHLTHLPIPHIRVHHRIQKQHCRQALPDSLHLEIRDIGEGPLYVLSNDASEFEMGEPCLPRTLAIEA